MNTRRENFPIDPVEVIADDMRRFGEDVANLGEYDYLRAELCMRNMAVLSDRMNGQDWDLGAVDDIPHFTVLEELAQDTRNMLSPVKRRRVEESAKDESSQTGVSIECCLVEKSLHAGQRMVSIMEHSKEQIPEVRNIAQRYANAFADIYPELARQGHPVGTNSWLRRYFEGNIGKSPQSYIV